MLVYRAEEGSSWCYSGGEANLLALVQPPQRRNQEQTLSTSLHQSVAKSYLCGHLRVHPLPSCGVGPLRCRNGRCSAACESQRIQVRETEQSYWFPAPGTLTVCVHHMPSVFSKQEILS